MDEAWRWWIISGDGPAHGGTHYPSQPQYFTPYSAFTLCSNLFAPDSVGIEPQNHQSLSETVPETKKAQREKALMSGNSALKKYKEETASEISDNYGKLEIV